MAKHVKKCLILRFVGFFSGRIPVFQCNIVWIPFFQIFQVDKGEQMRFQRQETMVTLVFERILKDRQDLTVSGACQNIFPVGEKGILDMDIDSIRLQRFPAGKILQQPATAAEVFQLSAATAAQVF